LEKEHIGADDPQIREDFTSGKVNWRNFCRNDLAFALMKKFPLLQMMEKTLYDLGAVAVQISGSGPSILGLFEKNGSNAAEKFREKFSGMDGLRIFTGEKEF
jgi:4-diphosphocytidyl-2C-methyl-D-erythritol kinase